MRIVSGKLKGRVIHPPTNLRARPTTDFAKENLFNVLSNIFDFDGKDVLDLFSGTGSIAFEFASREVGSVVSVELNAVHHSYIKMTAEHLKLDNIYAIKANAFLYLKSCSKTFNIIFADPPYDIEGIDTIPDLVFENNLIKDEGWLILEHSASNDFSSHPRFLQKRTYGSVNFSIFE